MNQPNPFGAGGFSPSGEPRKTKPYKASAHRPRQGRTSQKRNSLRPTNLPQKPMPSSSKAPDPNEVLDAEYRIITDAGSITDRPPLKDRIARFVAWAHLVLGVIYASSLVFRFGNFALGKQPAFLVVCLALIVLVIVYIVLEAIIGAWCETVNDILLGTVGCWPKALTVPKFFDQLSEEIANDFARRAFHQVGMPEVAAVIPHRPKIGSSAQSLLYMATYFGCFFYAPLSAIVKSVFWKVETCFGILFLAYLFAIPSISRSQR